MKSVLKTLLVVLVLAAALVSAKPTGDEDVLGSVIGAVRNCDGDMALCLKERALKYVDSLSSAKETSIMDGISVVTTGSSRSARSFEPLSEEPKARENQVEGRLMDSAVDFLENHVIQLRMPKSTIDDVKRSLEEGRGKKKKLKALIPIYALLQLKLQALIPLFLAIIAFAAVKGLLLAKAALLASGLVLLKKLLSKHEHHESYEVVAHPHHEHHEEHYTHGGHGGWGRSSQDPQDLAYNAYSH